MQHWDGSLLHSMAYLRCIVQLGRQQIPEYPNHSSIWAPITTHLGAQSSKNVPVGRPDEHKWEPSRYQWLV